MRRKIGDHWGRSLTARPTDKIFLTRLCSLIMGVNKLVPGTEVDLKGLLQSYNLVDTGSTQNGVKIGKTADGRALHQFVVNTPFNRAHITAH